MLLALVSSPLAADMLAGLGMQYLHCPDAAGAIIGLTSDDTYHVRNPADGPPMGTNPEKWTRVDRTNPPAGQRALNGSFTGTYMQVLPDDRDSYHAIHGEGSFTMTGLEYAFAVETLCRRQARYGRDSAAQPVGPCPTEVRSSLGHDLALREACR